MRISPLPLLQTLAICSSPFEGAASIPIPPGSISRAYPLRSSGAPGREPLGSTETCSESTEGHSLPACIGGESVILLGDSNMTQPLCFPSWLTHNGRSAVLKNVGELGKPLAAPICLCATLAVPPSMFRGLGVLDKQPPNLSMMRPSWQSRGEKRPPIELLLREIWDDVQVFNVKTHLSVNEIVRCWWKRGEILWLFVHHWNGHMWSKPRRITGDAAGH